MDKRSKKRTHVLRERIQSLQKLLANTRQQCDDPMEIKVLEQQIAKAKEELSALHEP